MTDFFALLDEPRRPWIDPDGLKQKFLARSSQVHPDRVHNAPAPERRAAEERYAELNTAYNCLREPKDRLRHLLELETGTKPADVQRIPEGLMEIFFGVAKVCKETDVFLAETAGVTSPLLKVRLFERAQDWTAKLNELQRDLNARQEELLAETKMMNAAWEAPTAERAALPLERLEQIYRLLGYFGRWSEQLQERVVQLSL